MLCTGRFILVESVVCPGFLKELEKIIRSRKRIGLKGAKWPNSNRLLGKRNCSRHRDVLIRTIKDLKCSQEN